MSDVRMPQENMETLDLHRQTSDVIGPSGRPMTTNDLPPANTKRWISHRKAEVVAGVRAGLISLDEACRRYSLSIDEFLSWQRNFEEKGLKGLRVTMAQRGRRS